MACTIQGMKTKRRSLIRILCPLRLGLTLVSVLTILLLRALRESYTLMRLLAEQFSRPVLRTLGRWSAGRAYSVAELLIALFAAGLLLYILFQIEALLRRGRILRRLYRLLLTLCCAASVVYAGFCLLWGVQYYGDDFVTRSGLAMEEISPEQLARVTARFAALADTYAEQVERDEDGICCTDRASVLERSAALYRAAEARFPCLAGQALSAKPVVCSRLMSYADFTGFFFPFTGEANVNTDFPPSLFAATVAHELAHQRGVAKEQEANFVAVLACLESGDADYIYSAALLAYTHLANALYSADYVAWEQITRGLSEAVQRDFAADRAYWAQFETPVQTVSNSVYEGFLQSYDQSLGLRSYGACVDLLVNYYDCEDLS